MHNQASQARSGPNNWQRAKATSPGLPMSRETTTAMSTKPTELGSAELKALRSSPLYSPQSSKPKSAQARSTSGQRSCPFETTFNDKERRFPMYNGVDRRLTISSEFRHMDILGDDDDRRLSLEVDCLYDKLLPLPDDIRRKQELVSKLEHLLNKQWPGKDFTVHAFGSTENMLATRNSDLDVCIETEWAGFGQQVCQLSTFMSKCGMEKVVCRAQAKVPVVTIYDPELRVSCDMNINNMLALRNTKLVKTYVQIDVRARKLIFAVKQWASNRALNEAVCNTLTSYTWTLLIINYLQTRKTAPVLPSLQDWPHEPLPPMDGIDVSFADDINRYDTLQTFSMQNTESVGSLLFGFFHYYSYVFNYNRDVASVRRGRVLNRKEKGYPSDNMFCIEEPFTTTRNLGNTADMGSFKGILSELQRAHRLLANGESLDVVFVKFDPNKANSSSQTQHTRQNKRSPNMSRKGYNNGSRNGRTTNAPDTNPSLSTHGFYQPKFSSQEFERPCPPGCGMPNHENPLSTRDQLQWQYVTMAEHNRLVLNSNPFLYPAQLMQYAEAYCKNDLRQSQTMQRAKSVPIHGSRMASWNFDTNRRMSETCALGPRGRANFDASQQNRRAGSYHLPQYTVSESELSRFRPDASGGSDLASALGLRQIEMIPQGQSPVSKVNRENLLQHDAFFGREENTTVSSSEMGESQCSVGLTLASSRSSPNSMTDYAPSVNQTYAQVSIKTDRASPQSNTYQDSNVLSTVSSHFAKSSCPSESTPDAHTRQPNDQPRPAPAVPVTYAAKASTSLRAASKELRNAGVRS